MLLNGFNWSALYARWYILYVHVLPTIANTSAVKMTNQIRELWERWEIWILGYEKIRKSGFGLF